tara:strand:+ start:193 stop:396 length:204 start_codon:yes stop_codon:yes gene_type:complete
VYKKKNSIKPFIEITTQFDRYLLDIFLIKYFNNDNSFSTTPLLKSCGQPTPAAFASGFARIARAHSS